MLGKLFQRLATSRRRPGSAPPAAHPGPVVDREAGGIRTVYDLFPDIEDLRKASDHPDVDQPFFWEVVQEVKPYTMVSLEGLYGIYSSIEYVARNHIPGDLVECGVFLGGSVLAAARFARYFGLGDRRFYLYDTFAGFPDGTAPETDSWGVVQTLYSHPRFIATARAVIGKSPQPQDRFVFVEGDVAQTLLATVPETIAMLRLDTDAYESTRVELESLYPRLSAGGVLIIDDYGTFRGARKATDEFVAKQARAPLLHRVSGGIRAGIKP